MIVLVTTARAAKLRDNPVVPYLLALVVATALVAPDKRTFYSIPYLPYVCLILGQMLMSGLPRLGRPARGFVVVAFWLYWLNGLVHFGQIIASNADTASSNRALASRIGHLGSTVLATLPFIFDEIENYRVLGLTHYWIQTRYGRDPIPVETLFADAWTRGARFVVMSREDFKFSGLPDSAFRAQGSNYRRIFRDEAHSIYELRAPAEPRSSS